MINSQRIGSADRHLVIVLFDQYRKFYQQPQDPALADRFLQARLEKSEFVIFAAVDEQGKALGFTHLYPSFSSVRATKNRIVNDL